MNNRHSLQDIAGMIAKKTGKTKADSERFLRTLFSLLSDNITNDKQVKIKGVGTFKLILVEARESVNVNTGERFVIPEHYKFSYLPDKDLKEVVNEPFSFFETTELTDEAASEIEKKAETEAKVEEAIEEEQSIVEAPVAEPEKRVEASVAKPAPIKRKEATPQKQKKTKNIPQQESKAKEPVSTPPPPAVEKKAKPKKNNSVVIVFVVLLVVLLALFIYFYSLGAYNRPATKDSVVAEPIKTESVAPDVVTEKAIPVEKEGNVSSEASQPEPVVTSPNEVMTTDVIEDGLRLTLISLKHFKHKVFWVYLYDFNKDIIKNPNEINAGTVIKIPNPSVYGIDANNPESIRKATQLQNELLSTF